MKIAILGSRTVKEIKINNVLPADTTEIVSGGARGVDSCAAALAREMDIKLTVFLPEYERYGRAAPIVRNKQIVDYADRVIVIWDGESHGSKFVIDYCKKVGKECQIFNINDNIFE